MKDNEDTPASADLEIRVKAAADGLSEHCDCVIILTTLNDGDGTVAKYSTRGNAFAIDGIVRGWLLKREAYLAGLSKEDT